MNGSAANELTELCDRLEEIIRQSVDPLSEDELQMGRCVLLSISNRIAESVGARRPEAASPVNDVIESHVKPLLSQSAFARHIMEKPFGYAGDFKLIQRIYDNAPSGSSPFERRMDECCLGVAAANAVRNRRPLVVQRIQSAITDAPEAQVHILSLACGPAAEVFDALKLKDVRERAHFHLVDIDARALEFVRERAEQSGLSDCLTLYRQDINRLIVRGPRVSGIPRIDLAYSVGLIDYFETRHVLKLMDFAESMLKPRGQLLLGNFHPRNSCRDWMDHVVDWKLIHRDEAQMNTICKNSAFNRDFDSIEFEAENINLFATVNRHGA